MKKILKNEYTLYNEIFESTKYSSFDINVVQQFLVCGPNAPYNFNNKLTRENFFYYFFTDSKIAKETRNSIIEAFNSNLQNVIILYGSAGSGKSVFINKICIDLKNEWEDFFFDFSKDVKIIDKILKKTYCSFTRHNIKNKNNIEIFLDKLKNKADEDNGIINLVYNSIVHLILKPMSDINFHHTEEEYSNLITSFDIVKINASKRIDDFIDNEEQCKCIINLLLIIIFRHLLFQNNEFFKSKSKAIFVFDNLEVLKDEELKNILEAFKIVHSTLRNIYDENIGEFNKRIEFVFVTRKTTKQHFDYIFRHYHMAIYREFDILQYDFVIEALLKKLYFLDNHSMPKDNYLYKTIEKIITIMSNRKIIEQYLQNKSLGDIDKEELNHFASKRLMPFFSNSFRNALCELASIINEVDFFDELVNLEYKDKLYKYLVNGLRIAILKKFFVKYFKNNYYLSYGIYNQQFNEIDESFSITALNILYWDFYFNSLEEIKYSGIELSSFLETFNSLYNFHDNEHGITTLLNLSSFFDYNNYASKEVIGSFIEIFNRSGNIANVSLHDILSEGVTENKYFIGLTDSGKFYVEYVFNQLEFYSAKFKIYDKALFLLKDNKLENGTYEFEKYLTSIYKYLSEYLLNLVKYSVNICMLKNLNSHKVNCFFKDERLRCHKGRCSLFYRYRYVILLINEVVHYIDRFRIYIISTQTDFNNAIKINNKLLFIIKDFLTLFKKIKRLVLNNWNDENVRKEFKKIFDSSSSDNSKKISSNISTILLIEKAVQHELFKINNNLNDSIEDIYYDKEAARIKNLYYIGKIIINK